VQGEERSEPLGRAADDVEAQADDSLPHVGLGEDLHDLAVRPLHDGPRRGGEHQRALQRIGLLRGEARVIPFARAALSSGICD
jgi:hypothetical protein